LYTSDSGQNLTVQSANALTWKNVVATLPGDIYPGRQCLIIAHYDAISEDPLNSAPGADDNASGTSAVLKAAKILKDYHFQNTIKFIAFSGEEQWMLGSFPYAQEAFLRGDTIIGVLNFDMIAWDGRYDDSVFVVGGADSRSRDLYLLLRNVIDDYGIDLICSDYEGGSGISDDASFIAFGYPAIFSCEAPAWDYSRDFNPYYHTTWERLWAFNLGYFHKCVKAAVGSIATLARPYIIGDTDSDGLIALPDVVLLANYILKGGPPPDPLKTGDVNCVTGIGLTDVIYLANYLLKNGPAPCQ
jgi:Zn-dependent M28 family amino/carboxypeptidase